MGRWSKDYKLDHYMFNETGAVFTLNELEDLYDSEDHKTLETEKDMSFNEYINSVKFTKDFTKVYPKNIEAIEDYAEDWYSYDDAFEALNKIVKALNLKDWKLDNGEWFLINLKYQKKNVTWIMYDLIENVEDYCSGERKINFDE